MRIDLVGTTADFRRFGHPQPLPINHLLCENRRTQGRMGEVGLSEPGLDAEQWPQLLRSPRGTLPQSMISRAVLPPSVLSGALWTRDARS
jgi:hypothetical protein